MSQQIDSLKDMMLIVSYNFGIRYSAVDKNRFCSFLQDLFQETGKLRIESYGQNGKKQTAAIIGNIEKANEILIAPFDTPLLSVLPFYRFYPLDDRRNSRNETMSLMLQLIITLMISAGSYFLLWKLKVHRIVSMIIVALILVAANQLRRNNRNLNRSTAAVSLLLYLALNRKKEDCCYAFIDNGAEGYLGLKQFMAHYSSRISAKTIIYADLLAYGDRLVAAGKKPLRERLLEDVVNDEVSSDLPLILQDNDNLHLLFAANKDEKGYWNDQLASRNDSHIDMERLEKIAGAFMKERKR